MNQHDEETAGPDETADESPDAAAGNEPVHGAPATGDDRVDEALTRLGELDQLDVSEHAGVVEDIHRSLQDTLAEEES